VTAPSRTPRFGHGHPDIPGSDSRGTDLIAPPRSSTPSHAKRLIATISILAGLGVLAVAVMAPSLLSAEGINRDITLQIQRTTGLSTAIAGTAHFSLLPQPTIEVTNIGLSDPSGALRIDADALTGYLRFLPLLVGRFEVARARFDHPTMTIDLDEHPMGADSAISRAAGTKASDLDIGENDHTRLGSVDFVGGTARLESRSANVDRLLEDINISIDWADLSAPAEIAGGFKFHQEPVELTAWFAQPLELLRGAESALTLNVKSNLASFSTSGVFASGSHLQYRGRIEAKIASLRRLAELTGRSFPNHGRFADLSLKCDANFAASTAALSNLSLQLDGNEYEGTLAIQNGDVKPLVSGTLATSYLDLAPFVAGLPAPLAQDQRWNPTAFDITDLGFADLDLRVSATRLRLAQMEFRDSALSLITKTGSMDLTLAEATANHGKVKGRVSFTSQNGELTLRAVGSLKDFRLRPVPLNIDGYHELSGSLNGTMALDSTGNSMSELMHNLAGKAQINLDSGEITRLDLDSMLAAPGMSERQKSNAANGDPDANAALDGASVVFKVADGRVELEDGRLQTKGVHLTFGGDSSLAERNFDLWALTQPTTRGISSSGSDAAATRISLTGSWDSPNLVFQHLPLQPRQPAQSQPRAGSLKSDSPLSYAPSQH
jgi:AsmA protein